MHETISLFLNLNLNVWSGFNPFSRKNLSHDYVTRSLLLCVKAQEREKRYERANDVVEFTTFELKS